VLPIGNKNQRQNLRQLSATASTTVCYQLVTGSATANQSVTNGNKTRYSIRHLVLPIGDKNLRTGPRDIHQLQRQLRRVTNWKQRQRQPPECYNGNRTRKQQSATTPATVCYQFGNRTGYRPATGTQHISDILVTLQRRSQLAPTTNSLIERLAATLQRYLVDIGAGRTRDSQVWSK